VRVLGNAEDFYRVRMMRLEESGEPDLEWRDDILYRTPPVQVTPEYRRYVVQAVSVDDDEDVTLLREFSDAGEAEGFLAQTEEDLAAMTKSSFEDKYFPDGG
jgi:hypothetical protein